MGLSKVERASNIDINTVVRRQMRCVNLKKTKAGAMVGLSKGEGASNIHIDKRSPCGAMVSASDF